MVEKWRRGGGEWWRSGIGGGEVLGSGGMMLVGVGKVVESDGNVVVRDGEVVGSGCVELVGGGKVVGTGGVELVGGGRSYCLIGMPINHSTCGGSWYSYCRKRLDL